jgi:hypothetical protein
LKKILLCILLLTSLSCFAEDNRKFSLFVGLGELYNVHSYRLGISSWEIGKMNNGVGAVAKNFYAGNSYVSFGPAITFGAGGGGVYGAVGYDFTFFNFLYLKTELNAAATFDNYNIGTAMIGLGIYW